MAIILPNTRNALGVPNRYSDLDAAGLRWTPPPVYRYDAYDVQGDEATLYAEDIDLDDYQYNVDSYNAVVVPTGYKGVTGSAGSMSFFRLVIDAYDRLCIDDGETPIYPADGGSIEGVTQVAYRSYFIMQGSLCVYTNPGYTVIDSSGTWSAVSFASLGYPANYTIGIRNGALVAYNPSSGVTVLNGNPGWSISGGVYSTYSAAALIGERYSSLLIDSSSNLYQAAVRYFSDINYDIVLTNLNSSGWQSVSGYMYDRYSSEFYSQNVEKRMYGIKNGTLQSIRHTDLPSPLAAVSLPASLQITEFSDWWKVVFVAPDEAVAIRRIAL